MIIALCSKHCGIVKIAVEVILYLFIFEFVQTCKVTWKQRIKEIMKILINVQRHSFVFYFYIYSNHILMINDLNY